MNQPRVTGASTLPRSARLTVSFSRRGRSRSVSGTCPESHRYAASTRATAPWCTVPVELRSALACHRARYGPARPSSVTRYFAVSTTFLGGGWVCAIESPHNGIFPASARPGGYSPLFASRHNVDKAYVHWSGPTVALGRAVPGRPPAPDRRSTQCP